MTLHDEQVRAEVTFKTVSERSNSCRNLASSPDYDLTYVNAMPCDHECKSLNQEQRLHITWGYSFFFLISGVTPFSFLFPSHGFFKYFVEQDFLIFVSQPIFLIPSFWQVDCPDTDIPYNRQTLYTNKKDKMEEFISCVQDFY